MSGSHWHSGAQRRRRRAGLAINDESSLEAITGLLRVHTDAVAEKPKGGNEFSSYLDQGVSGT